MRVTVITLVFLLAIGLVNAEAGVISDGDFSDWSFGNVGSATVTRETSDGNPGARLNVTTVSGGVVRGTAIKSDYTTTTSFEGEAFTLSLDVLSGAGAFGQGQAIDLLVEQNGTIYRSGLGNTSYPRNFDTLSFDGTFDEAAFSVLVGAGPTSPDFGGGLETRFGFAASNHISGTLTQYYDNFHLESTPIPEPSSFLLLCLAVVGLEVHYLRRK